MAKLRKQRNIPRGTQTYKYRKTGTGNLGTDPSKTPSGAALTLVSNDTLALAGANDQVDAFFEAYDAGADRISVFTTDAGEISGVPANGTIAAGKMVVGYLDIDRGKVKELAFSFSNAPTAAEAKAAIELLAKARWIVKSSVAGSCTVVPR